MINPHMVMGRPLGVWDYWAMNMAFFAMLASPILKEMYGNSDPHLMWVGWFRHTIVFLGQALMIMYVFYAGPLVPAGHNRFLITLPALCGLVALTPMFIRKDEVVYFLAYSLSVGFLSSLRLAGFAYGYGPLAPLGVPNNGLPFYAAAALPINILSTTATIAEKATKVKRPAGVKDKSNTAQPKVDESAKVEQASVATAATSDSVSEVPSATSVLAQCGVKAVLAYSMVYFTPENTIPVLFRREVMSIYTLSVACLGFSALSDTLALAASQCFNIKVGPSFDQPYLVTSLRDFWGKRWCLPVMQTLRTSVYAPLVEALRGLTGESKAKHIARCTAFCVTGMAGEILYRYLWDIQVKCLLFFVLQGLLVTIEELTRSYGRDEASPWATGGMAFLKLYYTARYTVLA